MSSVIVSQPGKQHTHLLLKALQQQGMLQQCYTVFAANKLGALNSVMPSKVQGQLKKRSFPGVPGRNIAHRPWLFLQEQLGKIRTEMEMIKKVYAPFDQWVASNLEQALPNILIGYENANLESFKKAKALGITTVLDLAQIHHNSIVQIHQNFGFLDPSYNAEVLTFINNRKSEALQYTDYIFTLSGFAKESLVANGIPEHKIFTVNLGLHLKNFYPKDSYNTVSTFRFLFVGTITRRKGLDVLFQAFKQLNLPNAELVLIGPMADGAALLKRYQGWYQYHPFMHHEALANQYRSADVFVFPSYLDSWAQTVVEAMACGTPVIVTEHTGAKDAVLQGGGFVIPPGDVTALKQHMLDCYNNKAEVEVMGKKAAAIATQYTLKNYEQQIVQALRKITDAKAQG